MAIDPILQSLNTAQLTAVTNPAPVLQVLAPPGSGKTKTLTARVAYLLSQTCENNVDFDVDVDAESDYDADCKKRGFRPQDVICCTFTIKASREMRERLARLVGEQVVSRLVLGTFHSICRRYLVAYGHLIGLKKGFGIADSNDSLAIIKRIIKRSNLNIQPNPVRSRISSHKAQGIGWQDLNDARHAKSTEQQEFAQIYREYEFALAHSNLLDYDDLLLRCADLLRKHPHCVSNVRAVLVDEFQDTNVIQYELMNLFAAQHRRITIVGDPDQSIYGFRSAEIKNLERMRARYPHTAVVLLENNYRSSGSILACAEMVIEQDTSRPVKRLLPTHGRGTMPVLRKLPTATAEAQWIVAEIKRCITLTGSGQLVKPSDIAILLRSASLSRQIESELGKQGVPYRMVGGSRFFDRVEIRLLLDYLRVISHPENNDALLRIMNVPTRKIGEETLKILIAGAERANLPLWSFIRDVAQGRRLCQKSLSKAADIGLTVFVGLIEEAKARLKDCQDDSAPRLLLEFVVGKLGFREYLTATYPLDEESRWANVEELLAQAGDISFSTSPDDSLPEIEGLEQIQGHTGEEALSRFLANVALSTEVTTEDESDDRQPQEKVTISTIHAAKGLEWPVVFVAAVYEGIIPHSRAEDHDEERRLLYVAMTRAQALLYLSLPRRDSKNGEETTPSSFLSSQTISGGSSNSSGSSRFRSVGPNFSDKTIFEIADILGRKRPSQEEIVKGLQAGLPSLKDDLWTEDGEYINQKGVGGWNEACFDGRNGRSERNERNETQETWAKRRRLNENEQSAESTRALQWDNVATTMDSGSSFSISNSTMSIGIGFSTARQHMEAAPPAPTSASTSKQSRQSTQKGAVSTTGTRKTAAIKSNQGTLSSFLGLKTESLPKPLEDRQFLSSARTGQTSQPAVSLLTSTVDEYKLNTAGYRVQTQQHKPPRAVPLAVKDTNPYSWMPSDTSSPPTSTSLTTSSKSSTSTIHNSTNRFPSTTLTQGMTQSMAQSSNLTTSHSTTTTTTTTMMSTTMNQLSSNQNVGVHGFSIGRKTLGVRRSLHNGWAERMNRINQRNQ